MKKSRKKIGILILSTVAFSGSIFFFPISLGDRYTCFYHRFFDYDDQVNEYANTTSSRDKDNGDSESNDDHTGIDRTNETDTKREESNYKEKSNGQEFNSPNGSVLLDKYLHNYAFLWWFSVALTALSIFLWRRLNNDLSQISRN